MKKRDFLKSAAALAGVTAVSPLMAAMSPSKQATESSNLSSAGAYDKQKQKVVLKKSLGFAMIKEELSLTDKFKLAKDRNHIISVDMLFLRFFL